MAEADRLGHPAADAVEREDSVRAVERGDDVLRQIAVAVHEVDAVGEVVLDGEVEHAGAVDVQRLDPVVGGLAIRVLCALALEDDVTRVLRSSLNRDSVVLLALDHHALAVGARLDVDHGLLARVVDGVLNRAVVAPVLTDVDLVLGLRRRNKSAHRQRDERHEGHPDPLHQVSLLSFLVVPACLNAR